MSFSGLRKWLLAGRRWQLIGGLLLLPLLLFFLFSVALQQHQQRVLLQQTEDHASALAMRLASALAPALSAGHDTSLQPLLETYRAASALDRLEVHDATGQLLAHSRGEVDTPTPPPPSPPRKQTAVVGGQTLAQAPLILDGKTVAWLRIALPHRGAHPDLSASLQLVFYYTLVLGILLSILTYRLLRHPSSTAVSRDGDNGERPAALVPFEQMLQEMQQQQQVLQQKLELRSRNEARLERALRGANDGLWEFNVQNHETYYSPRWKGMLGYMDHELVNSYDTWHSLVHPDDLAAALAQMERYLAGDQEVYQVDLRMRHKDGYWVDILSRGMLEYDAQGQPLLVSGTHMDVSNMHQMEAQLVEAGNTLAAIEYAINTVGIGIHFVRSDGGFSYVNDAACNMLGYRRDEMLQLRVPDIDPNFPADGFEAATAELRKHPSRFETTQLTKAGRTIQVEVILHYVTGGSTEQGYFVAFNIDLSERKQAEAERRKLHHQLLQAQKMESIGHLTGGIAHDFNNMLAVILGYADLAQLLCEKNEALDSHKAHNYVDEIIRAGKRAKELIAQMLVFSRREVRSDSDEAPITLLLPVVQEVSKMLRSSLPASIALNTHIAPDNATLQARIEPVQLHQILLNLGINARDAIADHGTIEIAIGRSHSAEDCSSCHQSFHGEFVVLSIRDSGGGIAADLLPRIFDPFFTTKRVGEGSGMGLSVVHGIVHSLGGHVRVKSEVGHGTTISILLPLQEAEEASLPEAQVMAVGVDVAQLTGLHLLVVDDEPALTVMLHDLLSLYGAEVETFPSAAAALDAFARAPDSIDLVVTDETMPGMSGLEMSRRMLEQRPSLPIIICTGYSKNVTPQIAHQSGIAGFMHKPLDGAKLVALITELTAK